jgi:hypothetical protein
MSGYLSYMQAKARDAEIGERVERARLSHPDRTGSERPGRVRNSTARVLLGLAIRLDHGLQPTTVRPSSTGPRI